MAAIKSKLKWLILGANGQLGQALQEVLNLGSHRYTACTHSQLDITNEHEVSSFFNQERPDIVVNAAGWTDVDLAEEEIGRAFSVNAYGPALAANHSKSVGSKFVHISTDYVFSGEAQSPWEEEMLHCPVSVYGQSKAEGERLIINSSSDNSFIVRTAWMYSQYQQNFAKTMLRLALSDSSKVEVVDDQIGQPTYAVDLAIQIIKMIENSATPGIYHGTNAGETTWFHFAQEIFALAGVDPKRVIPVSSKQSLRVAKRPSYSVLGHKRWLAEGLDPMRDWRSALAHGFPAILSNLDLER